MTTQSPVADMLVRIRNAQARAHKTIAMPASGLKRAIAKVLLEEGYIQSYKEEGDKPAEKKLLIDLRYYRGKPVITEIHMVSRPGLRRYSDKKSIPHVKNDYGITIISTNQGVMTGRKARSIGIGGEVICEVF